MALHTIVEHDTTHIKPYIDNVKQALSNYINNYGVKNLWDIDKYHTMNYEHGASSTYANGVITISCPTGGGGYFTHQNMKSWFDDYKGMPLVMTFDVKAEADNVPCLLGMIGAIQTITLGTTYQTIVVPISDVIYLNHIIIETSDYENAHTLTATNFMLTPASWYNEDSDFEPFAMTNQQLTDDVKAINAAVMDGYRTVGTAVANGTKTYSQALAELYTLYSSVNAVLKPRMAIYSDDGTLYRFDAFGGAKFSTHNTLGDYDSFTGLLLYQAKAYTLLYTAATNTWTKSEESDSVLPYSLSLIIL